MPSRPRPQPCWPISVPTAASAAQRNGGFMLTKPNAVIPAPSAQDDVAPETFPGEAYNPNKLNPQFPALQQSPSRPPQFTLSAHARGTTAQPATLPLLPQIQSGVLRTAGLSVSGLVAAATGEATITLSTTYGRNIFSVSLLVGATATPLATVPWALDSFIPFTDGLELTFFGITDGEISFSGVWEQ